MSIFKFCLFLLVIAFSAVFASPKAVLFNDTSAWYHWGCTGTSTALKEGIRALDFELESIPIHVVYALKEVPPFEEFGNREKFNCFCEKNPEIANSIVNADAVVITGEGTIHDLRAAPRALLYLAFASKQFLGKHVEIIHHSAYPKDEPQFSPSLSTNLKILSESPPTSPEEAKKIYQTVYSQLDFIAIREPISLEKMKNIGIASTLSFDCLPLYIRDHYQTPKQIQDKNVVLAGSIAHTKAGVEQLGLYLEELSKSGFKTKVLIGAAAFPARDDKAFVELLKNHCKAPWELINASSMEEWLETINHATLLVSGRFHHSIAAFCLNTPFIALNSNTPKIHAFCSLVEQPSPLLYSDPALVEKLLVRTNSILNSPPPDNKAKIDFLSHLAEKNFEGLKAFAKNKKSDRS